MGGAYLRSRIKQAGKWDQETIVSFFLCQYCSGEYLLLVDAGIAKRQTASRYLQTLATMGILREEQVGREKYYINDALFAELTR